MNNLTPLTVEQQIILTGYTGKMLCSKFSDFHEDVERRLGYSVFTNQFADKAFADMIKNLYKEDFLALMHLTEDQANCAD